MCDVPVPSGGPAAGVELRPDSAWLSPSAQQGMSPVAAALQLRGLALAGRGWETSAPSPRGCPAATAASLRSSGFISASSGLISEPRAGFYHGPAATLWPRLVIYFLLQAATQQPRGSEGKGLLPLYPVSLHYQDFSRSPEQSRNCR